MRKFPSSGGAAAVKAEFHIHLAPRATAIATAAAPPPRCEAQRCPWWPYSNPKDIKTNTILVLVFLLCTLLCAPACSFAIRYILRHHRERRRRRLWKADHGGGAEPEVEIPAVVYSEGTKLTAAECAICLSDFGVGERIRVLEKCGHGFHVQCVDRWLASRSSCPTCRAMIAP